MKTLKQQALSIINRKACEQTSNKVDSNKDDDYYCHNRVSQKASHSLLISYKKSRGSRENVLYSSTAFMHLFTPFHLWDDLTSIP